MARDRWPLSSAWLRAAGRTGDARWSRITANLWPLLRLLLRTMAHGSSALGLVPRAICWRRRPSGDAPAMLRLCRDGWFVFYGLVWACPGQPVNFSGRYSISGPFWSILNF
ncbi:hypothetical protein F511_47545 [Dorcoceras hygrometricum]|uniref:Uncharacterized protein n=1 Tax=Dorcoceras hygrometricum TaxID=472368 RepID=A0A2Z6ZXZ7_9LAMI|nr:hypothetical protein F511_47545 [Dorcoceras hygrometricum]